MKCDIPECVNVGTVEGVTGLCLCPTDRVRFGVSAQGKRIFAIARSLLAEWAELERCEKLNAGGPSVVAPTTEDT